MRVHAGLARVCMRMCVLQSLAHDQSGGRELAKHVTLKLFKCIVHAAKGLHMQPEEILMLKDATISIGFTHTRSFQTDAGHQAQADSH